MNGILLNQTESAISTINTKIGNLSTLATDKTDSLVVAINEIQDNAFSLSGISALNTSDKSSLVAAINEIKSAQTTLEATVDAGTY